MGTCIICGVETEGHVCSSHEEDVYFEFTGTSPDQLTPDRFYRGSVDGFADFGVFIDVGEDATGLLHTSELDRRLESLDWQPGDTVFVQVKNVRDNGNIDLGWSIRQHPSEFRGALVDTPEGDRLPEDAGASVPAETAPTRSRAREEPDEGSDDAGDGTEPSTTEPTGTVEAEGPGAAEPEPEEPDDAGAEPSGAGGSDGEPNAEPSEPEEPEEPEERDDAGAEPPDGEADAGGERLNRTTIDRLDDVIGSHVRIEGRIVEARQTSGPTVFEVRDETALVECAAFESAGVRAYPEAGAGDFVRIDGEVEERRGEVQVETGTLSVLEGEEREAVESRLEEALAARARPDDVDPLADHPAIGAVREGIVEAATAIRRAVFDSRPIVIRHSATVDGYVAGAAIERAVLPLVREEHQDADAEYHYFDRRPIDGRIYDMQDAVRDTTSMLSDRERHGEKVPLFVFANAGSTEESRDGFDLLATYGGDRVVIEGDHPDGSMADSASAFLSPRLDGDDDASTAALAANVAAHVNDGVREDLAHLPAVGYWRDVPGAYADLATEAGYDAGAVETIRGAIALQAFYQAYEDKRELIADILFENRELAERAGEQFEERLESEVRTARPHVEEWTVGGQVLGVLDVDAFTHEYEFPPIEVLLAELADREDVDAIVGADEDRLLVWSGADVDMREVGDRVAEEVPEGGVETRGGREGYLVFLSGERESVLAESVRAVAGAI